MQRPSGVEEDCPGSRGQRRTVDLENKKKRWKEEEEGGEKRNGGEEG
jgi:hypothetical protein